MAFFGFIAELKDGSSVRECDVTWDEVPDAGIGRLSLVEMSDQGVKEVAAFAAAPGRQFFFSNEVVAWRGGQGVLSAKAIGYVEDGAVTEAHLDMLPRLNGMPPVLSRRQYPESEFLLSERALRAAAP